MTEVDVLLVLYSCIPSFSPIFFLCVVCASHGVHDECGVWWYYNTHGLDTINSGKSWVVCKHARQSQYAYLLHNTACRKSESMTSEWSDWGLNKCALQTYRRSGMYYTAGTAAEGTPPYNLCVHDGRLLHSTGFNPHNFFKRVPSFL